MPNFIIKNSRQKEAGFAALLSTLIIMAIVLVIISGVSLTTLLEQKITKNVSQSAQAYYAAESGIEDSLYRIINNKNYQATNNLTVDEASAVINITDDGSQKNILVNGEQADRWRNIQLSLNITSDLIAFYYGAQVGEGGLTMSNNSSVEGGVYSNGNIQGANGATITGDVWVGNTAASADQQSQVTDTDYPIGQTSPIVDGAQSFTAANSGQLVKVSLYLKKTGAPTNKTVRLLTDSGGKPSRSLVASGAYGTLIASQVSQSSYSWITVTFNSPPSIVAGTKYWISLDSSLDSGNYFIWGRDSGDTYVGGTGKYSPNWNASPPSWSLAGGDLGFRTWLGTIQNSLNDVAVSGDAHAALINDCDISGDAYYETINGSTVHGTSYPGSPNPGLENLPISEANITDWKAVAEAGGVITGDYTLNAGATGSLGPAKIVGDLIVSNSGDLTVTGTIYVTGAVRLFNGVKIRLGEDYGTESGILVADGQIAVNNNAIFFPNSADSHLLFLTTKTGSAINIANNTSAAIFYASQGTINVSNNATLKEVTGYQINLSNGARIIYESGLASMRFSSGSGGSWLIDSWREVP
jgi:Tfp pilus assembly protein PilX